MLKTLIKLCFRPLPSLRYFSMEIPFARSKNSFVLNNLLDELFCRTHINGLINSIHHREFIVNPKKEHA